MLASGGLPQAPPGFSVVYTNGSAAEEAPGVAFAGVGYGFGRGMCAIKLCRWGAGTDQQQGGGVSCYLRVSA